MLVERITGLRFSKQDKKEILKELAEQKGFGTLEIKCFP